MVGICNQHTSDFRDTSDKTFTKDALWLEEDAKHREITVEVLCGVLREYRQRLM